MSEDLENEIRSYQEAIEFLLRSLHLEMIFRFRENIDDTVREWFDERFNEWLDEQWE